MSLFFRHNVDGESWDHSQLLSRPEPPHVIDLLKVVALNPKLAIDVIQNSDTFAVWDAVDGVIALVGRT
jgi:hypothetical protein